MKAPNLFTLGVENFCHVKYYVYSEVAGRSDILHIIKLQFYTLVHMNLISTEALLTAHLVSMKAFQGLCSILS